MDIATKLVHKTKTIFGREPKPILEKNNNLPDVSGPPLEGGTHASRPDTRRKRNWRGRQTTRDGCPERGGNSATAAPVCSDQEPIICETEYIIVSNDYLGALDPDRQSINSQDSSDWQDVEAVDRSERFPDLRVINPSISDHLDHRAGVGPVAISNTSFRDGISNEKKSTQMVDTDVARSNPNPPTDTAPTQMLQGNIVITGGHFTQAESVVHNVNHARPKAFEYLQQRVAPAAFHNSAQRSDPPRCHPNTRVAILQEIYDWIMQSEYREQWLLWLNGAAGAGKSALMQSLAERCIQAGTAIATFFFFRGDSSRNTIAPLVATLVYQLLQAIPEISEDILLIIECNPLIFSQSLESQIQQLVVQPLLRLPAHFKRLFLVFIDGLDECNDRNAQVDLIKALGNISSGRNIPVVFLVSSRREPQIEAEFAHRQISDLVMTFALDNSDIEQTSDDIRRFLTDKFCDIKETHLFKHYLSVDWPPASSVEEIVSKSSGQFIFASVVVKYLLSPRSNPARQLEVIRGIRLRDPSSQNPFAHLDALYEYIFSQVEVLDHVLDIIGFVIASGTSHIDDIQGAFLLEAGELKILFADLTAVILCEPPTEDVPKLKFLHASLPDFLVDKTRSEQYHIDLDKYRTNLLCRFLERCPPKLDPFWSDDDLRAAIHREWSRLQAISDLLENAKASEQLRHALMNFKCTIYSATFFYNAFKFTGRDGILPDIIQYLRELDFGDHGKAYYYVVDMFAAEYVKHWPSIDVKTKQHVLKMESSYLLARIMIKLHT